MKRKKPTESAPSNKLRGEQRLNKLLASAGLGSRRQVDELIEQGRVEVDGVVVDQLGAKVDVDAAKITVDGELLKRFKPVYYALNKPSGVLCTNRDPQGRPRAVDLIPGNHRCFPVGRLDASSVGLLLMTNDGELTQRLTHPKHGVAKTYFVVVAGHIEPKQLKRLQRGIWLSEGLAKVEGAKIRRERKGATELEITLCEGKNREIRRVLARIGNKVVLLRRTSIGPLKLADLPEGAYRPLMNHEVAALYQAADEAAKERKRRKVERRSADGSDSDEKASLDSKDSAGAKAKASRAKPMKKSEDDVIIPASSNRDPFAWDDDEDLLAASPFAEDFSDEDSPNEFESDSDWSDDGGDEAEGLPEGSILVDDGPGPASRGKILEYGDEPPRSSRKVRTASGDRKTSGKARLARRENRPRGDGSPFDERPRKFARKGSKKRAFGKKRQFGSENLDERRRPSGKGGSKKRAFKKGGFKKSGFKKGGFKKSGFKKGGSRGKPTFARKKSGGPKGRRNDQ
jgi:23S rRNA pseudouridine2605 synthase